MSRHPNYRDPATLPRELRRTTVPLVAQAWVRRVTGAAVVAWRRLPGASSSAVHALRLSDGSVVVLRRWTWRWVLDDEPVVTQREVDALTLAAAAGLPAPRLLAADTTGEQVGDGVPATLMTRLPGRAVGVPALDGLAEAAAAIHAVVAPSFGHTFYRWCMDALSRAPAAAETPKLWEKALEIRHAGMPHYVPRLIHRDYHPGNVLWSRGRLSGVVDWSLACRGPWECDVATCRSNLFRLSGRDAADRFLAAYSAATRRDYHPYWDLNCLLEQDADHWTSAEVHRSEPWLRRILTDLGVALA